MRPTASRPPFPRSALSASHCTTSVSSSQCPGSLHPEPKKKIPIDHRIARTLNPHWLKVNRTDLTVLSLLRPRRKGQLITVDYREEASLDQVS